MTFITSNGPSDNIQRFSVRTKLLRNYLRTEQFQRLTRNYLPMKFSENVCTFLNNAIHMPALSFLK